MIKAESQCFIAENEPEHGKSSVLDCENSDDSDRTALSAQSDQCLRCLRVHSPLA